MLGGPIFRSDVINQFFVVGVYFRRFNSGQIFKNDAGIGQRVANKSLPVLQCESAFPQGIVPIVFRGMQMGNPLVAAVETIASFCMD